MDESTGMDAAGWVCLAGGLLILALSGNAGWAMFNLGSALAWFIGARIVRAIQNGRIVIHASNVAVQDTRP